MWDRRRAWTVFLDEGALPMPPQRDVCNSATPTQLTFSSLFYRKTLGEVKQLRVGSLAFRNRAVVQLHQHRHLRNHGLCIRDAGSSVCTSRELAPLSYHSLPRISNSRRWGKNFVIFSNCSSEERPMEEIWRERIEGNMHDGVESPNRFELKKRVWRDSKDARLAI